MTDKSAPAVPPAEPLTPEDIIESVAKAYGIYPSVAAHLREKCGQMVAAAEKRGREKANGCGVCHCEAIAALSEENARLREALESYVADADVSLESLERVAEEFRRDTGFLAPGKDEAAAVNSGVTAEERRHAWNIWVGKHRRDQLARARAALAGKPAEPALLHCPDGYGQTSTTLCGEPMGSSRTTEENHEVTCAACIEQMHIRGWPAAEPAEPQEEK